MGGHMKLVSDPVQDGGNTPQGKCNRLQLGESGEADERNKATTLWR